MARRKLDAKMMGAVHVPPAHANALPSAPPLESPMRRARSARACCTPFSERGASTNWSESLSTLTAASLSPRALAAPCAAFHTL